VYVCVAGHASPPNDRRLAEDRSDDDDVDSVAVAYEPEYDKRPDVRMAVYTPPLRTGMLLVDAECDNVPPVEESKQNSLYTATLYPTHKTIGKQR
jgi:hypothetical protein